MKSSDISPLYTTPPTTPADKSVPEHAEGVLGPQEPDLTPPHPLFAGTDAAMRSASTNLSTEAQARSLRSANSRAEFFIPGSTAELSEELVTPPGSGFYATTAPPHSQRAGPDPVPLLALHGFLEAAGPYLPPSAAVAPPTADAEDGAPPHRRPKLLQRLKDKMHVWHAHT
ncbi:hypothetical protein B0H17DRAFT_1194684 [Mycena rosella]|uniref:Uncharacterized protein n=1 Tax=Mycena rosella TaxID=1033263 RepID=A0AAD7E152_MYCRO|nr:hypothetical protein B0H17DRAFT_1194684 [Mycena rosella]